MTLIDLLQVMDDITELVINATSFEKPLHITNMSKMPTALLGWQIDYVGAKCEDVLNVFLIEKN